MGEQLDASQDFGALNLLGVPDAVRITLSFSDVETPVERVDTTARAPELLFRRVVFLNLARRVPPTAATSSTSGASRPDQRGGSSGSPGMSGRR